MLLRIAMALAVGAVIVAIDRPDETRREIERVSPVGDALVSACRDAPERCLPR